MKRIFGVLMVAGLVLTGCKESNNNKDGGGGTDMKVSGGDMTTSAKAEIGEPCTKNADCAGNACFVETMGIFKQGYCSKSCALTSAGETSCGDGFTCGLDLTNSSATTGRCYKTCDAPDACRDGYVCYVGGSFTNKDACLPPPDDLFTAGTCDPTATNTCAAGENCRRIVHNDGSAGVNGLCFEGCVLGVGTCGADDQCILRANNTLLKVDAAALTDVYANDKGIYTTCLNFTLGADSAANGAECLAENDPGDGFHYSYACVDGSQCALANADRPYSDDYAPALAAGDKKCYTLCYQPGQIPVVSPDAGVEGTPFTACPGGTTCKDTFGLFNNTAGNAKVGLCQP